MLRYEAGTAHTLVRGGAVVVLPEPSGSALVESLWDQLGHEPGVVEVLQVLTAAFGSGLRTLPPFAVAVVVDRRVHVAVRGDLVVGLEHEGDGVLHVDGVDVTTWSERVVDDVVELTIRTGSRQGAVASAGTPREDRPSFPLGAGVVLADSVSWELVARRARPVQAAAAPAAATDFAAAPENAAVPDAGASASGLLVTGVPVLDALAPAVPAVPEEGAGDDEHPPQSDTLHAFEETIAPPPELDGDRSTDLDVQPAGDDVAVDGGSDASDASGAGTVEEADDDYGHLWGSTVMRTVEDAAVRVEDEEEHEPAAEPVVLPPPVPVPPVPDPSAAGPSPWEAPGVEDPADPFPAASSGLIAGVPREWTGATPAAAHRAATVNPEDDATDGTDGTDHDGHTVLSSAIADLRAAAEEAEGEPAEAPSAEPAVPAPPSFASPPGPGQQILARTCPQGHPNPPSRDDCKICGAPLEGDASLAVRPTLGRLAVSTGQSVELDRGVIVGRRPRTPRTQAAEMPRLVTVPSPQQDISRSHVEISLEGWHVLVADMATTNGTTLIRAGQAPRRLHPSEPVLVTDGDLVDLGDGVTMTFEGIW